MTERCSFRWVLVLTSAAIYLVSISTTLCAHMDFDTPRIYRFPGGRLFSIVAGDFNQDGNVDMAANDLDSNVIIIMSNLGSGEFTESMRIPTGDYTRAFGGADFNGDGFLDLAASYGGDLALFLNDNYGGFETPQTYPYSAWKLVPTKIDADGDIDIVTCGIGDSVRVLKNDGNGSLSIFGSYFAGTHPDNLTAADIDNDTDNDILVINRIDNGNDSLTILRNNGQGELEHAAQYSAGGENGDLVCRDLDGDGDLDVVVANGTSEQISVLMNQGGGVLGATVSYSGGGRSLTVVDIDGDEDNDVISAYDDIFVFRNTGDGQLSLPDRYVAGQAFGVTAFDIDSDNDQDLAATSFETRSAAIEVLRNGGDGQFARSSSYPAASNPSAITCVDLDRDSKIDVLVPHGSYPYQIAVIYNQGDGVFLAPTEVNFGTDAIVASVAGDLDGDEFPDLAMALGASRVAVFWNDGSGELSDSSIVPLDIAPFDREAHDIVAVDIDRDSDLDLVTANKRTDDVSVLDNDGSRSFLDPVNYAIGAGVSDQAQGVIAGGDLNGDSYPDIAVARYFDNSIAVLLNDGGGALVLQSPIALASNPWSIAAGDIDNDGDLDLILLLFSYVTDTPTIQVLRNGGNASFVAGSPHNVYQASGRLGLSDLDGDNDLDAVVLSAGHSVAVVENEGSGNFNIPVQYYSLGGGISSLMAIADMHGDGYPDIVVAGTDSIWILANGAGPFVAVRDEPNQVVPVSFSLSQNYPNPFNMETVIQFSVPGDFLTKVEIFNILGQHVTTVMSQHMQAGPNRVTWDGTDEYGIPVSSGVYLYRIKAGEFTETKKMLLLK